MGIWKGVGRYCGTVCGRPVVPGTIDEPQRKVQRSVPTCAEARITSRPLGTGPRSILRVRTMYSTNDGDEL
jgi:hypothetical protein